MAFLRFPEVYGTDEADYLTAGSDQITYGYNGNDTFITEAFSDSNFLVGGDGNDTYNQGYSSVITILDSAGFDTLYSPRLGLNDPNTFAVTVNGQHLIAGNIVTGDEVAIAYWLDPQYAVDQYILSDGTYSHAQIVAAVQSSPNYLGDFSVTELTELGAFPPGTRDADLNELISYVLHTEAAGPPPPPIPSYPQETAVNIVESLYIAYFGRPADPAGLDYYVQALVAGTTRIDDIATSFGQSAEAQLLVNTLTNQQFIEMLYLQSFSRQYDAKADGSFWLDAINNGLTSKELAFIQILDGAQGEDAETVSNKVVVATTFTNAVDTQAYHGQFVAEQAKILLNNVNADPTSLANGISAAGQLAEQINQSHQSMTLFVPLDATLDSDSPDKRVSDIPQMHNEAINSEDHDQRITLIKTDATVHPDTLMG